MKEKRLTQYRLPKGNIVVSQKKGGHWCIRTFLKKDITWVGHDVPKKQDPADRFLEVSLPPNISLSHFLRLHIHQTCTSIDSQTPEKQ